MEVDCDKVATLPRNAAPPSSTSSSESVWRQADLNALAEDPSLVVVYGDSLKGLSDAEVNRMLRRKHVVFARTTPAQKLELVKMCQKLSDREIVTLTGDGLMDALPLKQADIGIAVGAGGSVFAKEASDIVVSENSLANIAKAVEEARLLFDNLKKTIAYTLSHLLPELLPVLLSFILGFPLGLTSLQVLTIDLLTEIPPSIALIFEPAERDVMRQRPRRPQSRLVTTSLLFYSYFLAGIIVSLGCLFAYFTVFWHNGFSVDDLLFTSNGFWRVGAANITASSGQVYDQWQQVDIRAQANAAWHITLVMSQVVHLFTCTTRRVSLFRHGVRNWLLVAAVSFEVAFLFFLLLTPAMQRLVEIQPPPSIIWLFPAVVGLLLLVFNEARKLMIRRKPRNPVVKFLQW